MSTTQRRIVMCGQLVYLFCVLSWALFTLKARTDSNNAVIATRIAMARQVMIARDIEWREHNRALMMEYAQQVKEAVESYGFLSYHQDENVLPYRIAAGGSTYFSGKAVRTFNNGAEVADPQVELEQPDSNRLPELDYQWIDVTIPPGVYKMDHPFRPLPYVHYHMYGVVIRTTAPCAIQADHHDPFLIEGGYFHSAKAGWCF